MNDRETTLYRKTQLASAGIIMLALMSAAFGITGVASAARHRTAEFVLDLLVGRHDSIRAVQVFRYRAGNGSRGQAQRRHQLSARNRPRRDRFDRDRSPLAARLARRSRARGRWGAGIHRRPVRRHLRPRRWVRSLCLYCRHRGTSQRARTRTGAQRPHSPRTKNFRCRPGALALAWADGLRRSRPYWGRSSWSRSPHFRSFMH